MIKLNHIPIRRYCKSRLPFYTKLFAVAALVILPSITGFADDTPAMNIDNNGNILLSNSGDKIIGIINSPNTKNGNSLTVTAGSVSTGQFARYGGNLVLQAGNSYMAGDNTNTDGRNNVIIKAGYNVDNGSVNKGNGDIIFTAGYDDPERARIAGDTGTLFLGEPLKDKATRDKMSAYKLVVNGGILAEAIKVKLNTNWPDYVFNEKYHLRSLAELGKYISKNKHLPDMPSSEEIADNGINLAEMNGRLLRKVEELTLYTLELQKTLKKHEELITALNNKLNDRQK